MLFDYEALNTGNEFQRIGNSLKDSEDRLDIIFFMIDGSISRYGGDVSAANEAKRLLLVASTPDISVQSEILSIYGDSTEIYADLMNTKVASEIGVRSWWND